MVEVDFLCGVDFDEDSLMTFVFADVDGRTLASEDTDALLGVDLLFGVDVKEFASDLRQSAFGLGAVEDVVEEDLFEADAVARVVGSDGDGVVLVFDYGHSSRLIDALCPHELGAEEHVLAYLRGQLFACLRKYVAEEGCLL